ncbi:MAG TPA: SRPBCC family protein [Solirubrobacteraceae bacterium]
MSTVESSIVIAASPERVWEVVMDAHRYGEWVTIHRGLRDASPGPVREGSHMEQTLHLRGADIRVRWLLVECHEPSYARWQGRGPARTHARIEYRLTAVPEGTRFDYENQFDTPLGALGAFASRHVMGHLAQREADRSLATLRDLLERENA